MGSDLSAQFSRAKLGFESDFGKVVDSRLVEDQGGKLMHKKDFLNARILVVDDEPDRVRLIVELLSIAGFSEVRTETNSGNAALSFKDYAPDLVILDLHMARRVMDLRFLPKWSISFPRVRTCRC